jgi:hypothetical protein
MLRNKEQMELLIDNLTEGYVSTFEKYMSLTTELIKYINGCTYLIKIQCKDISKIFELYQHATDIVVQVFTLLEKQNKTLFLDFEDFEITMISLYRGMSTVKRQKFYNLLKEVATE